MGIHVYKGEEDFNPHSGESVMAEIKGRWVPARFVGYSSFWHSLKCAWLVFREKADIVVWNGQ